MYASIADTRYSRPSPRSTQRQLRIHRSLAHEFRAARSAIDGGNEYVTMTNDRRSRVSRHRGPQPVRGVVRQPECPSRREGSDRGDQDLAWEFLERRRRRLWSLRIQARLRPRLPDLFLQGWGGGCSFFWWWGGGARD